jgi:hypothetical protein
LALASLLVCAAVAGPVAGARPETSTGCEATVGQTTLGVAQRIYGELAHGHVGASESNGLAASRTLLEAVQRQQPAAAQRILDRLASGRLVDARIITRGGRTLASIDGAPNAIAPIEHALTGAGGRPIGRLVISTQSDGTYASSVAEETGAPTIIREGSRQLAGPTGLGATRGETVAYKGASYRVDSFAGRAYPSGALTVTLLVPLAATAPCHGAGAPPSAAQATADTFGAIAQRIYHDEQSGSKVRAVVGDLERSAAFKTAIAHDDAAAARAVIVGYFRTHLHVVRVRALLGSKLVIDLGGPHVIAPAEGALRDSRGRRFGRFLVSIQDDRGYEILLHTFTGAEVLMRMGSRQVVSTLPSSSAGMKLPERGQVAYGGSSYAVFSLTVAAFPSGPLRISLLVRQ